MGKIFYSLILVQLGYLYGQPLLIYNQFPRVWNMKFEAMTKYVPKIRELGFNVVWVNPFFESSDASVKRINEFTGEKLDVKGSLYAMKLDDLPIKLKLKDTEESIKIYTRRVKDNGMVPIFDLVLRHIAKDSAIIKTQSSWFRDDDGKWDDVYPFNYTEANRREIFEAIWVPLLDKMVDLGFQGMRVDYGTDVDQSILQMCIKYLQTKISNPLSVFGEALINPKKDVEKVLKKCNNTDFTHLTNLSIFLSKAQILSGKKEGYEWFLHDLGLKRSTCTRKNNTFEPGTIGFSGSHDHGTTILSYFLNKEITQGDVDEKLATEEIQEDIENQLKCVHGKLIQERLCSKTLEQKLEIVKEHMAISAFSSDAGWCCFSSDEWLSEVVKSPFVRADGSSFHNEETIPDRPNAVVENFIRGINSTFSQLREDKAEKFWVEMFYTLDDTHLIFVRHLSADQLPADIVCVKIKENAQDYSEEGIKNFLTDKHAEISFQDGDDVKFYFPK